LTSHSLYILTAFHKESVKSAEAALKYFLFGGMSAAFTLFGLSLIYGLAGSTFLRPIADALRGQPLNPLLIAAIVMTVIGFGFKVAAAPFHLWAPDAYQGGPTPSAALIASGSKVASFFLFAKILMVGFEGVEGSGSWGRFVSGGFFLALLDVLWIQGNLRGDLPDHVKASWPIPPLRNWGYTRAGRGGRTSVGEIASAFYYVSRTLDGAGSLRWGGHIIEQTRRRYV